MPDGTPNYGWRIPKSDGTDYIIPDDIRLPVGSIDTQMKVEENARLANTASLNGLGLWVAATGIVICTDASLTQIAGSSINFARYSKIGKRVRYQGMGSTGATAAPAGCAITLPNSQAGVPSYRNTGFGMVTVWGTAPPSDQSGVGFMGAGLDRLIIVALSSAYRGVAASHTLKWDVEYEVV